MVSPPPIAPPVRHRPAVSALTLLLLVAALGCGTRSEPTTSSAPARYLDLLRFAETADLPEQQTVDVQVWGLDGDLRATLAQTAPQTLELGPFELTGNCVLRFGIGLRERHWQRSDGVDFEVTLLRDGSRESIFRESLLPAETPTPRWLDREVAIPTRSDEPFSLQFSTGAGPRGDRRSDHAGWSRPHLRCGGADVPAAGAGVEKDRPPVVLISIDTLRWDHLGVYGYARPTSPTLDAFADQATVFDSCFAPSPYTLPSHATLLTGLAPEAHRAGFEYPQEPLRPDVATLAGRLAKRGYRTVAITAGGLVSAEFGLDRGFDEWRELRRANLPSVLPAVFDVVGETPSDVPLFLFLHTYDVHGPYEQPREYRHFSVDDEATRTDLDPETWRGVVDARYHRYQHLERFAGPAEAVAAYDSGIRFVDAQLARLFDYLRELNLFEHAVIVITSDHGESLFERNRYFGHSHTLEDREIHVPLLVRLPGGAAATRISALADLADVAPMVLRLAGVDARDLPGIDHLAPDRPAADPRPWLSGGSSHIGARYVRSLKWKLISPPHEHWTARLDVRFGPTAGLFATGWQLYDLTSSPPEADNLFRDPEDVPGEVRRLMRALREEERPGQRTGDPEPELDAETERELKALGYLQ